MESAGDDCAFDWRDASKAAHHDRNRRADGRADTELSVGVITPTFDGASSQSGTRMVLASSYRDRAGQAAHRDRQRTKVARCAVTDLTRSVESPAFDGPTNEQGTRMGSTGRDRDHTGKAGDRDSNRAGSRGAVTDLSRAVVTPAFRGARR